MISTRIFVFSLEDVAIYIYIYIYISLVGSSDLNLWKENKTNSRTIQQQHLNLPGGRKKKKKKKKKI
jgi:hypothetical protein